MVRRFTPEPVKTKMEFERLSIIRKWIGALSFFTFLFSIVNALNKKDPLPIWMQIVHNILNVTALVCLVYSKYRSMNSIYIGAIALQIRVIFGLF